jgi:beta-galactosidase
MKRLGKDGRIFRGVGAILVGVAVTGLSSCSGRPVKPTGAMPGNAILRQQTLLDADWLFHPGDVGSSNQVIAPSYDDRQWQRVHLPHDYVLDGAGSGYSSTNDRSHGYLPVQMAWYRKHFFIPKSDEGKLLQLEFGGVFRDSEVWLNGRWLGKHPSGYTPFQFDITRTARCGAENVVVVRVDPRRFEGWWYEGGGIYRQVSLTAMDPLHVATWGTYVTSKVPDGDQGAAAEAALTIQTTVRNDGAVPVQYAVMSQILGPDGIPLKAFTNPGFMKVVAAGGQQEVVQNTVLDHPRLWSTESPQLYQLQTTLLRDGRAIDFTTTTFGIRTIRFEAEKGFFLNGHHVEIYGTASHQDFAGVGIAVPDSLQAWRVGQLKKMGCNAWRTAHNPPSEALLDACDRLGMLVMDENRHLGDCYAHHSPKGTAATDLADLACMIQRDRNHPSIIMWSMCNEEGLQGTPEGADIFSAMMKVAHRYDRTRPITCAMNAGLLKPGIADVEEIIGVNYNSGSYDAIHQHHPGKAMFGSEDTNDKTTRGEYVDDRTNGLRSCYNLSEKGWLPVVKRPFVCGSFTWTGFDYKGEPNPYGWPDISNNTGLLDVCGFPKDKCYYFESCWSAKPMVHLLPDGWNWPGKEGQNIRVIAFSNVERVELFLNGQSLGAKPMPRDAHLEWEVPYQPGQLVAKGYRNGKEVAADTVETTGAPARIQLAPDRTMLQADGEDAVVVPVSILDAKGRVVPDTDNRVRFQLTGDGRILGVGNGNPSDHDPDKADERRAFHGHCMAVVQAGSRPAVLQLTVTSPGLTSASIDFQTR